MSQHLKVLKDAGLVTEHAAGTRRIYELNAAGVIALHDQLDTFWSRAMASYHGVSGWISSTAPSLVAVAVPCDATAATRASWWLIEHIMKYIMAAHPSGKIKNPGRTAPVAMSVVR